ncbi:hypothetical protein [Sphingomonas oligophenolica]|uniref:hypothetical protein n=1 Tax=Sphingomonas oligophenolica TaxID=301154 RepID=UPI001126FD9D|nr:hypothetical protein [Sphingomonas oligophenolica]
MSRYDRTLRDTLFVCPVKLSRNPIEAFGGRSNIQRRWNKLRSYKIPSDRSSAHRSWLVLIINNRRIPIPKRSRRDKLTIQVFVAARPANHPERLKSELRARLALRIIVNKHPGNFSGYVPDPPMVIYECSSALRDIAPD